MIGGVGASGGSPVTAAAPTPPLAPPDISPYRQGNTGIDYATTFDSGRPGARATVVALVHGNELCGAVALDHLFRHDIRPARGTLTLVFANAAAYRCFDPARPNDARFLDEDLNRLWSERRLRENRLGVERRRARELRPIIEESDCLLDLHSMQRGTVPLLLSGPSAKGRAFARRLGSSAVIVADAGHPNGRRLRDYGRFNDEASPHHAILAECGPHFQAETAAVALDITYRFLATVGTIDAESAAPYLLPGNPPDRWIEVTHCIVPESDDARLLADIESLEVIERAGTAILLDGAREIATPYDDCVPVMPARRLARGQTAVRLGRYVPHGGVGAA